MKILISLFFLFNVLLSDSNLNKNCFKVEDKKEFISCLECKAKKSQSIKDINFLASIYVNEKDYKKAITLYEKSASKDDIKAMYYLGGIYNEGLKDYDKALFWFEKSNKYNYLDSSAFIAKVLDNKFNKDDKKVREYLQKRIDNKEYIAYEYLGAYEFRHENYDKAINAYKKQETSSSMYALGSIYLGHLKDSKNGLYWLKKAAKLSHKEATHSIGFYYLENKDYDKALLWFEKAEELGVKNSSYAIADVYKRQEMYDKAKVQYLKMIKNGKLDAYNNLVNLLLSNNKLENAIKVQEESILKGDSKSSVNLGYYYMEDLKDFVNGLKYYKLAYEMGNIKAANNIAYYYFRTVDNIDKTIEWYKKAAKLGDSRGINALKRQGLYHE